MNLPARNRQFGNTRLIVIGAVSLVAILAIFISVYWSDSRVLKRKHEAFITAIEKRSASRLKRVLSENYSDRWDFNREDAVLAMMDAGSTFLVLAVDETDPVFSIDGKQATVEVTLRVSGKPLGFAGQEVIRHANRLKVPWNFTWKKEGGPGSWRLIQMENGDIPDNLYGYEPGDIKRALRGGIE
ncbi:MAG: hypothetical protein HKN23_21290 [Verrucomicrobiales bacterium]|nr:hypothetical protein [Verrucomicrobiales bacterium]